MKARLRALVCDEKTIVCASNTPEAWKPVVEWESLYEVSDFGRIRSLPRETATGARGGSILKPYHSRSAGRTVVALCKPGVRRDASVSRLVLTAFVGPCPVGRECCHNDGNFENNRLINLRWDTPEANKRDRDVIHKTTARGSKSGSSKLTESGIELAAQLRRDGLSITEIANRIGISKGRMSRIFKGDGWRHVDIDRSNRPDLVRLAYQRSAAKRGRTERGTFA